MLATTTMIRLNPCAHILSAKSVAMAADAFKMILEGRATHGTIHLAAEQAAKAVQTEMPGQHTIRFVFENTTAESIRFRVVDQGTDGAWLSDICLVDGEPLLPGLSLSHIEEMIEVELHEENLILELKRRYPGTLHRMQFETHRSDVLP